MADYILIVQLDVDEAHLDEFNDLYDNEHVPSLLSVSGVVSGQRYEIEADAEDDEEERVLETDDESYLDIDEKDFRPSEEIPTDQSIAFPVDI